MVPGELYVLNGIENECRIILVCMSQIICRSSVSILLIPLRSGTYACVLRVSEGGREQQDETNLECII